MITVELWHKLQVPTNEVLRNLQAALLVTPPADLKPTHTHVCNFSFFENELVNDVKEPTTSTPASILQLRACGKALSLTQDDWWKKGVRATTVGDVYIIQHNHCLSGIAMYVQDVSAIRLITCN